MANHTRAYGGGIYQEVKQVLTEHDPVFAALENEKRLGWESKDVERLWKLRTEKLNVLNEASRKNHEVKRPPRLSENPFSALAGSEDEDEGEDEEWSKNLSVTGQKLIRAGKGPSYDKYYEFYSKLFFSAREHADLFDASARPKRFMDIGCAPGGLCAYFIRDLGWSGVGFTLQLERGGLKVRFKDPHLEVFYCDMSEMGSVEYINSTVEGKKCKFDFINCGVVMGKHQVESIGEDRETALQILRVNRNQFLIALKWLENGGDLFWVFQSSSIGCWLYFLKKLQSVFESISLYSTLVPSRSPVYAICRKFKANSASAWIKELEATTEFTDSHIDAWNVRTWQEAEPLIQSLRKDLYKIWNTQREGLQEIREAALARGPQEERLLKKLSGSSSSSSFHLHRKVPVSGSDTGGGWRTTTSSTSSFKKKSSCSEADQVDSWRSTTR